MDAILCHQYQLFPTSEQEAQLLLFADARRWVWNHGVERKRTHNTAFTDLCAELVVLKRQPETSWLKQAHSQVLQQALHDLERSCSAYSKGIAGRPGFKSKRTSLPTFRIAQYIRVIDGQVSIPKIGLVSVQLHRPLTGTVKSATVKQDHRGFWFVAFVCHIDTPEPKTEVQNPVGIDVGLTHFLTDSNGEKVGNPRFYRQCQKKLRKANQNLHRKKKGSKNRTKARKKVARTHARIRNQRKDFLHKLANQIVEQHDFIGIEDLCIKGLSRTKTGKSFADAAHGQFRFFLTYKAQRLGGIVIAVDRFFPSSKRCHVCGEVNQKLDRSEREWNCPCCQTLHDRDHNAAINLLREALRLFAGGTPEKKTPAERR